MLPRPVVVVNAKTYRETTGDGALRLVRAAARVAADTGAGIAIALQASDLRLCRDQGVPVYAQHFDAVEPGQHTGRLLLHALRDAGATGALINHSERRLRLADIARAVVQARDASWTTVVCTNDTPTTAAAAALGPTFVAIEPPALIGGDVSVTDAEPGVVRDAAQALRKVAPETRLLCGAGIKTGRDVAAAMELGADGVLLASGVTKAKDPEAVLRDLLSQVT